ncbi:RNA polymerase principal sigma factor HrdB [compost metagenome]
MIRASGRYDVTKGFKFISFAVWWIRQSIMVAIAEQKRLVRLPGNQIVGITKTHRAIDQLEQELERLPSTGDLQLPIVTFFRYAVK